MKSKEGKNYQLLGNGRMKVGLDLKSDRSYLNSKN